MQVRTAASVKVVWFLIQSESAPQDRSGSLVVYRKLEGDEKGPVEVSYSDSDASSSGRTW